MWGLWEVMRGEPWWTGIVTLWEETWERQYLPFSFSFSLHRVKIQWEDSHLQTRKKSLYWTLPYWHLDLRLPRFLKREKVMLVFYVTQTMVFCYSTQHWMRQRVSVMSSTVWECLTCWLAHNRKPYPAIQRDLAPPSWECVLNMQGTSSFATKPSTANWPQDFHLEYGRLWHR